MDQNIPQVEHQALQAEQDGTLGTTHTAHTRRSFHPLKTPSELHFPAEGLVLWLAGV